MTKDQMITAIRKVIERYNISEQGFNTRAFNDKASERIEIKKSELHCNNDEKVKTCMIINCYSRLNIVTIYTKMKCAIVFYRVCFH